jgi:hypothetical protein
MNAGVGPEILPEMAMGKFANIFLAHHTLKIEKEKCGEPIDFHLHSEMDILQISAVILVTTNGA